MLDFMDRGAITFEYGNNLRAEAQKAGVKDVFRMGSFVDLFIRPLFCQGMGPFRWIALSGDPQDIYTTAHRPKRIFGIGDRCQQ
jgi:urocanate hydratase